MRQLVGYSLTSFFVTGFSNRLRCVNAPQPVNPSRSASSLTWLLVKTRVVRFGSCSAIFLSTFCIRLRAHSNVFSLGDRGKLEMVAMSLSVRSMASCGPATPRFSMVGILWPVESARGEKCVVNYALRSKCSICSFPDIPRRSSSRSFRGFK